jgi:signal transduction histidine kinase
MNEQAFLNWSALAVSIFNMLLSLWLGLTILFNAERRSWGVFLAVSGLLASAAFFFGHSIILGQGAPALVQNIGFWWHVVWVPVVVAPYIWYLLMLWYCGYWDDRQSSLRRRQRGWLWLSVAYTLFLAGLLIIANPLPSISREAFIEVERLPALGNLPLIILAYPPYILLCIGLSLDALLRPAPSGRVMGDLARRRARPWLMVASLVLLLVTLVVSAAMVWLLQVALQRPSIADLIYSLSTTLGLLDLLLVVLLMVSLLLLGQALISYEIFTGKTLPRRGFQHQWRNTVLLVAVLSSLAAWGVTAQFPTLTVILSILVFVAFTYALSSWQSFAERERSIQQLRPFVSSQNLFDSILNASQSTQTEVNLAAPFSALCQDVLATRRAALIPLGALAALGGTPLYYPDGAALRLPALADFLPQFTSPHMAGFSLDPARYDGAIWVAPLWSERGLNGLLFLGEKSDGGFYSLEEIEIARASAERLVDIQAIAVMARRLMLLQRQRLAESKVLDQQTRRILHDDVLPNLHAALLELSENNLAETGKPENVISALSSLHRQISDLLHDLPRITAPEVSRLGLFGALRETVTGELRGCFATVLWDIPSEVEEHARGIQPLAAEVAFFAAREVMRNAAKHANAAGGLVLNITAGWKKGLEIVIEDNGAGPIELKSVSTGQGLVLHSTMMAVIGGSLALESAPGLPTCVTLFLPQDSQLFDQK